MEISLFYITHKNESQAQKLADILLDESLIACSNIHPITSAYTWNGDYCQEKEVVLLLKTRTDLENQVEEKIKTLHPYDCPCIIHFRVHCNVEYYQWIIDQTNDPADRS